MPSFLFIYTLPPPSIALSLVPYLSIHFRLLPLLVTCFPVLPYTTARDPTDAEMRNPFAEIPELAIKRSFCYSTHHQKKFWQHRFSKLWSLAREHIVQEYCGHPDGSPGMSDVSPLSGIAELTFDSFLLSPLSSLVLLLTPITLSGLSFLLPTGPFF